MEISWLDKIERIMTEGKVGVIRTSYTMSMTTTTVDEYNPNTRY